MAGVWAIEVGDQFPNARVRGIDLSPTQPVWVPPNVDFLVDEGTIAPEDRDLFWYAETAEQIWRDILTWYDMKGEPLLPPGAEAYCMPG